MKNLYFLLLQLLIVLHSYAQNPQLTNRNEDAMRLVSSTRGVLFDQKTLRNFNPVYEHKGNTLKADSGDLYKDDIGREFFEAYGNVVITQPSGTVIYADHLHYEAATQFAILTQNVRVIDDRSVLTTNHLTYTFRDQRGNYTGGGRIVTGKDTITSTNAYYFERTKDTYFRNKVVVRSEDVIIHTDTMRYNSLTRDNYFFGPTNIQGREGENLYTERGVYNTGNGIAKFNLNNLYTEGSKFLKGDSLYYDRSLGNGEAFRNVVFVDTTEKYYTEGGYGKYRGAEESITMADRPLVKYVVVNDSAATDSTDQLSPTSDSSQTSEDLAQRTQISVETDSTSIENSTQRDSTKTIRLDSTRTTTTVDTVYMTADTIFSRMIPSSEYIALQLNLDREGGQLMSENEPDYGSEDFDEDTLEDEGFSLDADSLSGEIRLEELPDSSSNMLDSLRSKVDVNKIIPPDKTLKIDSAEIQQTLESDSTLRSEALTIVDNAAEKLIGDAMNVVLAPDSSNAVDESLLSDSLSSVRVADTTLTRIVKAYHNVRMFKSDLQAVADSVYYGMQDSMFRFMGRPMIWAEDSQISADTIYLQMLHQRLDNGLLKGNAFMVNAVLDTVKFNQLKGRKMTVFFANNHIERLFVDGNAENLAFNVDEKLNIIKDMAHDKSSRIKILFANKEVVRYVSTSPTQNVYPLKMVNQDNEILPGFLWRPQDRPKSMEDMMSRKRELSTETNVEDGQPKAEDNQPGRPTKKESSELEELDLKEEDLNEEQEKTETAQQTTENTENESFL